VVLPLKLVVELTDEARRHKVDLGDLVSGMYEQWREMSPHDQQRRLGIPVVGNRKAQKEEGPREIDGVMLGTWLQKNL
jgi:hypothetical protein